MRDGVAEHPWLRLHRQNSPGASTSGRPGHSTDVDPAASSSAVKIEDSPGDVEMADDNSNNNNTVSKGMGKDTATDVTEKTSVKEGKGKGKAGEVKDEKVVVEGKGKGKAKEVTESTGAKEGKGKGKAKEVTELVEDVTEETTVTEKPKNKGKSKGTKKARGRSQGSTATNTFKSVEPGVPTGSDDEPTGPTPSRAFTDPIVSYGSAMADLPVLRQKGTCLWPRSRCGLHQLPPQEGWMLPDPCPSSSRLHGGRVLEAGTVSPRRQQRDGLGVPASSSRLSPCRAGMPQVAGPSRPRKEGK